MLTEVLTKNIFYPYGFVITVCTIAVLQKQSFSHDICFGRICEINLSQI